MEYKFLGQTGVRVSGLCLGTMMFGGPCEHSESLKILDRAFSDGINFIDTADCYSKGESEKIVGQAISHRREQVILATKGGQKVGKGLNDKGGSRLHLMGALDKSLARLATDYVDIYYLHVSDSNTEIEETLRAMEDMVRSGRVRYVACSNFRAWEVCDALWHSDRLGLNRFSAIQPLYNIVNRGAEVELLPCCQRHRLAVVSYSPLARGVLTGKYSVGAPLPENSRAARKDRRIFEAEFRPESITTAHRLAKHCDIKGVTSSQFAIAWVLANKIITSVIIGPRNMNQYLDNLSSLDVEVSIEDEEFVDSLISPGAHSGSGFQDPAFPVLGRVV